MARYRYGDVNGDGVIDQLDVVLILNSISGNITLSDDEETRADIDHNYTVSASDAGRVAQHIEGVSLIYDTVEM